MIFSRQKPQVRNETIDGLQSLTEWLGLGTDELSITNKKSLTEITIYTCIKILSETLSKLPLKIFQDKNGIKKATEHYLYPMLKLRPNAYMSSSDFWKCIEAQRNIYGNAYVWIDRNKKGTINGLYPLDSEKISIYVDDKGLINSKCKLWYVYSDKDKEYKLESTDILHFKSITFDGIVGINPIKNLEINIENAKSSSTFLNNSYKNGMQTKGLIQYVGDLSSKAEQTFRERFEEMSNGLKNANKVSLLPIGYQFQPIAQKMVDAQFLENTNLTIRQLTAAFGIKLHQVNDLEKSSYASTSEEYREFYTDTLLSILTMYEQELTFKLLTLKEIESNYYMKFNADIILRTDIKSRYEAYRVGVSSGFLTPNEAREKEELEAKEGGDILLVNGSYVKITEAGKAYEGR